MLVLLLGMCYHISAGGDTHQKKRRQSIRKGEVPIRKNIAVVDLDENFYAPTYIRRAKGLVKSGRARWSDENNKNQICLLESPALTSEEDNEMDRYDNNGNKLGTAASIETTVASAAKEAPAEITISYILGQIELIRADSAHIAEALKMVKEINTSDGASYAAAQAIGTVVEAREATNQEMLSIYKRMYKDMQPPKESGKTVAKLRMLEVAKEIAERSDEFAEHFVDHFGEAFKLAFNSQHD